LILTGVQIDDSGLLPLIAVASVNELQAEVLRAMAGNQAIYPTGGQTMLNYGLSPSRPGWAVDLCGLNRVIDYPARDMTITVQAGITVARLQQILAKENQRLPVDVPLAERATLGGALATNMSGPRRYGFGTWRDYVIGISVVNDQGEEVKAGGRVVKNVAGYDLCKLYVGSLGTLGIITQVTLKVRPRPEKQTLVELQCPLDKLDWLLESLNGAPIRPCSISALNPPAARQVLGPGFPSSVEDGSKPITDWLILVGFEDNKEAVAGQMARLQQIAGMESMLQRQWQDGESQSIWTGLADFPLASGEPLTFKANLLPRATAAFCRQAAGMPEVESLQAEAGNGIVVGHVAPGLTLDRAGAMLTTLLETAAAADGNLVLLRCPPHWKSKLRVWGRPRRDFGLMRAIKEKLDPRAIFNPGRFVDGI